MKYRVLNAILLIVIILSVGFNWSAGRDYSRPHLVFLPDMAYGESYSAFAENPNLPGDMTLQTPPEGTVARGYLPMRYEATPEDAERAGRELLAPFPLDDPAVRERGAFVYAAFCQQCHGAGGLGDGLVARRGFPPPPSLLAEHALDLADGQIFHILTFGQGNMPSHAALLSRDDRWKVISHIRSLQNSVTEEPAGTTSP